MLNCRQLRQALILTMWAWCLLSPQATRADAGRARAHERTRASDADGAEQANAIGAHQMQEPYAPTLKRRRWSANDDHWYERNRQFRIGSGVVSALGGLLLVIGGIRIDYDRGPALCVVGAIFYGLGSTALAASTLYGANEMRRRGKRVSKVPGILSVVGLFGPPILWIAAPMQGANLRRAHEEVAPTRNTASNRVLGLSLRAEF